MNEVEKRTAFNRSRKWENKMMNNKRTCFVDGSCVCCHYYYYFLVLLLLLLSFVLHVNVTVPMHTGLTIKCICTINITWLCCHFDNVFVLFSFVRSFGFNVLLLFKWNCIQLYVVIFPNYFYYMATPTLCLFILLVFLHLCVFFSLLLLLFTLFFPCHSFMHFCNDDFICFCFLLIAVVSDDGFIATQLRCRTNTHEFI